MKRIIAAASVALMTAAFPMTASATCIQIGTIIYSYLQAGSTASQCLYMRTGGLTDIYYYTCSNDDAVANFAANAVTSQNQVYVEGNATSCPTSGTARFMGTTTRIFNY